MTTIVSAFISGINERKDRNLDDYFSYGKLLLKSTTPKIIFLDETIYNLIKDDDYDKNNTLIVKCSKFESYLYDYINTLHNFMLDTDNPSKDTLEYMFIICNKTEWIKKAVEIDIFNSDNFVWVDFGLKHVCDCTDDEYIQKLNSIQHKKYNKVRIGNIWNLSINYNTNIFKQISWYFAGGIFGGNKESLLKFAYLMKDKCIEIIDKTSTIMWEVNIWYILYKENPDLFEPYPCSHCNSIFDNY